MLKTFISIALLMGAPAWATSFSAGDKYIAPYDFTGAVDILGRVLTAPYTGFRWTVVFNSSDILDPEDDIRIDLFDSTGAFFYADTWRISEFTKLPGGGSTNSFDAPASFNLPLVGTPGVIFDPKGSVVLSAVSGTFTVDSFRVRFVDSIYIAVAPTLHDVWQPTNMELAPLPLVPLPATLPLMLAGIVGLGWVGRRRSRAAPSQKGVASRA